MDPTISCLMLNVPIPLYDITPEPNHPTIHTASCPTLSCLQHADEEG
jgi:hypothetical protein